MWKGKSLPSVKVKELSLMARMWLGVKRVDVKLCEASQRIKRQLTRRQELLSSKEMGVERKKVFVEEA